MLTFQVKEYVTCILFQNESHFFIKNNFRYNVYDILTWFIIMDFYEIYKKFAKYQILQTMVRIYFKKSYFQENKMHSSKIV
jgi:hypothetical protein